MSDEKEKAKQVASEADALAAASRDWLARYKNITEAVPYVYKTMTESEVIRDALSSAPPTVNLGNVEQIGAYFRATNELYRSENFLLPLGALPIATTGTSSVSGAANIFMTVLAGAQAQPDPATQAWLKIALPAVQQAETDEVKLSFIRTKLRRWQVDFEAEFNLSLSEYARCRAGAVTHNAAGIALRNVLDRLNGRLLQLARKFDSTATVKKWADAAIILARGTPSSPQVSQLVSQETQYRDLYDNMLSGMLKNTSPPTSADWDLLYARYISLLNTVLGLIDFRDGT